MRLIKFVWDEGKNRINRKRHGISFEEAQTVFFDDIAIEYFDPEHSADENRFILANVQRRREKGIFRRLR